MQAIKIGTCGYERYTPPKDWKKKFKNKLQAYADAFHACELNSTFYNLPTRKTAERWRSEVPEDFTFCIKAFQAITHLPTSPTWRRAGIKPTKDQLNRYGWLRPTNENFEAWLQTKEICDALEAKVCVIQCPPNFKCTPENVANMREFFSKIDRGKLTLAWEPRGNWKEYSDEIAKLCEELELVHVVDLMRREPLSKHSIAYIRLHGLNPREYDYNYNYSLTELKQLATKAKALAKKHREVYIMFNNYSMYDNAQQLMKILKV
ncbi:MAG: DUF72 domain-containing protein [Candidatus Aenigmarchaeota archaeon]|nr:DUF72 domain-containing protein [Candidatus Aenigmarchaeota archaeon]